MHYMQLQMIGSLMATWSCTAPQATAAVQALYVQYNMTCWLEMMQPAV
jgi:hypothetical protein